jgi:hypothetical protein
MKTMDKFIRESSRHFLSESMTDPIDMRVWRVSKCPKQCPRER